MRLVGGQHLGEGDARDGEHEADFDVQPDQDQVGRLAGRAPHRRVLGKVEDQAVPDFVEPVHAPEGQPGEDQVPVAPLDLHGVDIDDQGKQRDDVPLELASIAQYLRALARLIELA